MPQSSTPPHEHERSATACRFDGMPDALNRVCEIKQRLKTLEARDAELIECQTRIERERAEVAGAIAEAEADLNAAVAAPVAGGQDPTLWLPDELLLFILVELSITECPQSSSAVCRRWRRLCLDRSVKRTWEETRWELAAEGREPRIVDSDVDDITWSTMCAGAGRTMYCGTRGGCIQVRSDIDGSLRQVLTGHTKYVTALAVGLDGTLYSGSEDTTIRVWSGATKAPIRTLEGHTNRVFALAVSEACLSSGDDDGTIRVWECSTGHLVHMFPKGPRFKSLASDGRSLLYAGATDRIIRVWSLPDCTLIRTLDITLEGPTNSVVQLVVDKQGTLYSMHNARTSGCIIRVWSGTDGALLRTLDTPYASKFVLAPNGTLFTSDHRCFCVWPPGGRPPLEVEAPCPGKRVATRASVGLSVTCDGRLWVSSRTRPELISIF